MPFKKTNQRNSQQVVNIKRLFIGRTDYLDFFVNGILKPEDPSHNIISISGQGGVGETTMLQRFLDEIDSPNFREYCFAACVDELQGTPASVMERIADQLKKHDHFLKRFEEGLVCYKEVLRRMQSVGYYHENEDLVREIVDTAGSVAENIPFAGGIVHNGANVMSDLILEKGRTHQFFKDAARLEDPIGDLTKIFVKDLNQQADILTSINELWTKRSCRIILFFDAFEKLAEDIAPWLLDHFLSADINANIVLVISGRDSIESSLPNDPKRWLPFIDSGIVYLMSLNAFKEEEIQMYLQRRGITDPEKIRNVSELSKGLPLYLSLLTSNPEGRIDPNAEVVENFLCWIPKNEFSKRQLALNASLFSQPFTKDDLSAFSYSEPERTNLYHWIITQPFIQNNPQDGRYTYHDLAKDLFRRYLYQSSREDYYAACKALTHHYLQQLVELQSKGNNDVYTTRAWEELVFALIQQAFLLPDDENYLIGIEYVVRTYEYSVKDDKMIKTLKNLLYYEHSQLMTVVAKKIVIQLVQYLEVYAEDQYQGQIEAIKNLLIYINHDLSFPKEVIACLYRCQGSAYRSIGDYQRSLEKYEYALTLVSDSGKIYRSRGQTYRLMERYAEALKDFDRAIELDEKDAWAIVRRGETYRLMGRYAEALKDFDRAIELDEKDAWAIVCRGETYQAMERYVEALKDFDRAIELNEKDALAIACRGQTYRLMKRYAEALKDFDRAIELDEKDDFFLYHRALVYFVTHHMDNFHADLHHAFVVNQNRLNTMLLQNEDYYRLRFNAALYLLANDSIQRAIDEYSELSTTCFSIVKLIDVIDDLKDFLAIQPVNVAANQILQQLEIHMYALKNKSK